MKNLIGAILLIFLPCLLFAQSPDQCYQCHKELESEQALHYETDVHRQKGISCAGCHGGDPSQAEMEASMDPAKGYIGKPVGEAIADLCLKCHADAGRMSSFKSTINVSPFQQFKNSVHGKADVATCISCHGVHQIRSPEDPQSPVYAVNEVKLCASCHGNAEKMKRFNPALPTDQLDKYQTSVHGRKLVKGDPKVATCSDCHGAHDIFKPQDPRSSAHALNVPKTCAKCHSNKEYMQSYHIPTDQYDQYVLSVHGEALLKKQDTSAPACNDCHGNHGAAPPGVLALSHVCGSCHALNAEYFGKSAHAKAFQEADIAQCEACHGNHEVLTPTDEMLHAGKNSVCETCHGAGEKGYQTAEQMYGLLKGVEAQEEEAGEILHQAEAKGMDVSDANFKMKDIPGALIKARTVSHTSSLQDFKKEIDTGVVLAQEAKQLGQNSLKEYSFRRKGLGVSTLFITLLAVALYLKIRQIEGGKK